MIKKNDLLININGYVLSLLEKILNANIENGIYISMHGSVKNYKKLVKNRELGKFLEK